MKIIKTYFNNEVILLKLLTHTDNRGDFCETYNTKNFINAKFFYYDTFIDLQNNNINIHIADLPYVYEENIQFDISKDNYNLTNNYRIINNALRTII